MCVFTAGCDIRLSQCSCSCFTDNLSCCSPSKRCRSLYLSACCWLDVGLSPAPHSYFKSRGDHGWTFSSWTRPVGVILWKPPCFSLCLIIVSFTSARERVNVRSCLCQYVKTETLRLNRVFQRRWPKLRVKDELPAVTTSLFCHIVIILNKRWWLMKLYNSHG